MRRPARFWRTRRDGGILCTLCPHSCVLEDGQVGVCGVRASEGGKLWSLNWGSVVAAHMDPIEKKPLYHFKPGSWAFSIAAPGCNLGCLWCQNWEISQMPRELPGEWAAWAREATPPERVVEAALARGAQSVCYTYTEPTVFIEYAMDVAQLVRERSLLNTAVTNGFINPGPLRELVELLDGVNVDLKSLRNRVYRDYMEGRATPVLNAIRALFRAGVWVELTTLIIPGVNDDPAELREMAAFIRDELAPWVPWHLSRFFPAYRFQDAPPTPLETLRLAREIGLEEGLLYVYLGNVPGESDTVCPSCGAVVVERWGYSVRDLSEGGRCPACGRRIEGVF